MLSKSQRQPDCFGFAPFLVFVHDRHSSFDGNLVDGPRLVAGTSDNNVDMLISNRAMYTRGGSGSCRVCRLFWSLKTTI
jgi:hypothetical protein